MGIPQGLIIIWSGELNTIPSGWLVCNGSNNTPDLRNRFVVAAGSSFAFNTIGGFADAIVPTHNHTVTGVSSGGNHTHTGIKILNSQSFGTYAIRTNTPNAYGGQTFALTSTTTN